MKKMPLLLCCLIIVIISGCTAKNSIQTTPISPETVPSASETVAEPVSLINPGGLTMSERILVPKGYKRTHEEAGSFGSFLREYRMEPDKSPVLLYNGSKKTGHEAAVFSMFLGNKDLQQCADSIIRIYAEYFRSKGMDKKIAFHFVSGFLCDWNTYKTGKRIVVNGNNVSWGASSNPSDSDDTFESYLDTVFTYASTISLANESKPINESDIRIGDIFIKAGSPGHVVMVADMCEKDGRKAFLLAQGYMPAQQFHVLINEAHPEDPWYYEDEIVYPLHTPEYTFDKGSLMRPQYLE